MASIGYTEPGTGKQIEIEVSDGKIRAPRNSFEANVIAGFEGTEFANEIRAVGNVKSVADASKAKTRRGGRKTAAEVQPKLDAAETAAGPEAGEGTAEG
jgi:hypothetical protein